MQHEVFVNPAVRSRTTFPLLAVLQADLAGGDRRIVAPLVPRHLPPLPPPVKAVPVVTLDRGTYALMLPLISSIEGNRLRTAVGSIAAFRDDITRALDWLLFGI